MIPTGKRVWIDDSNDRRRKSQPSKVSKTDQGGSRFAAQSRPQPTARNFPSSSGLSRGNNSDSLLFTQIKSAAARKINVEKTYAGQPRRKQQQFHNSSSDDSDSSTDNDVHDDKQTREIEYNEDDVEGDDGVSGDNVEDEEEARTSSFIATNSTAGDHTPIEVQEVSVEELRKLRLQKFLNQVNRVSKQINQNMKGSIGVQSIRSRKESAASQHLQSLLRDYQKGGIEWLCSLHINGMGGILGDEMGLGKTLQIIGFFLQLYERYGVTGPHLVVAPLSVMGNWTDEMERYVGDLMDVHVFYGERDEREESLIEYIHKRRKMQKFQNEKDVGKISIVLTTYEIVMKDLRLLKKLSSINGSIQYLVIDEAHRLKRKSCVLTKALSALDVKHRILLTGTPLQNNLQELWSLLSFILPNLFDENEDFQQWFNRPFENDEYKWDDESDVEEVKEENTGMETNAVEFTTTDDKGLAALSLPSPNTTTATTISSPTRKKKIRRYRVSMLSKSASEMSSNISEDEKADIISCVHQVLKPFLLRRVKSEVLKDIPAKLEKVILCPLSPMQLLFHKFMKMLLEYEESLQMKPSTKSIKKNLELKYLNDSSANLNSDIIDLDFKNLLMQLRKLCNHLYLFLEDIQTIPDDLYFAEILNTSGKLAVLDKVLDHLLANKSKILIFCQFTTMLDILQGFLTNKGIISCRLDGNTDHPSRVEAINAFSAPPTNDVNDQNVTVFLLSTRAGGVGINLQAADTVILFDSDWNPQQDLQAIARVHRIGQTKPVLILRLISSGPDEETLSVDEYILQRAKKKLEAGSQILADGIFDMGTISKSSTGEALDKLIEEAEAEEGEDVNDSDPFSTFALKKGRGVSLLNSLFASNDGVLESYRDQSVTNSSFLDSEGNIIALDGDSIGYICNRSCAFNGNQDLDYTVLKISPLAIDSIDVPVEKERARQVMLWKLWIDRFQYNPMVLDFCKLLFEMVQPYVDPNLLPNGGKDDITKNRQRVRNRQSVVDYGQNNSSEEDEESEYEEDEFGIQIKRNSRRKIRVNESSPITKSLRSKRKRSKRVIPSTEQDETDGEYCLLCGKDCLTHEDYQMFKSIYEPQMKIQQEPNLEEHRLDQQIQISEVNKETASDQKVDWQKENMIEDLLNTMIICDECDGEYHLICVGLEHVPAQDWYCRLCTASREIIFMKDPVDNEGTMMDMLDADHENMLFLLAEDSTDIITDVAPKDEVQPSPVQPNQM